MNESPCKRDRRNRKVRHYSRQARDWFTVLASAFVVAIALVTLTLMAVILSGCTALGYEQHAAATAAARGCYCAGSECKEIKSAAGQAAVAAAGGQVVNIAEVRREAQPNE